MSNFNFFNNINFIGTSGSGKTTFSKSVANILNIKYIELDSLYWNANWVESDDTEFIRKIKVIITYEKWVIDGNYSRFRNVFESKLDTIIILDYPFFFTLFRIVKRTFKRYIRNEQLWHQNTESLSMILSKESIVLWMLNTYFKRRKMYSKILLNKNQINTKIIRLRSNSESNLFLKKLYETNC